MKNFVVINIYEKTKRKVQQISLTAAKRAFILSVVIEGIATLCYDIYDKCSRTYQEHKKGVQRIERSKRTVQEIVQEDTSITHCICCVCSGRNWCRCMVVCRYLSSNRGLPYWLRSVSIRINMVVEIFWSKIFPRSRDVCLQ